MKRWWVAFFFILAIAGLSCEDPIDIELPSGEPNVVVEGWVTDQPGPYRVKLSKTLPFDSPDTNPRISGAAVSIIVNGSRTYILVEDADHPGEYITDSLELRGAVGSSYRLVVETEDKIITSTSEIMNPSPPFDTLQYSYIQNIFIPETFSFTSGYLVTGFVNDAAERSDYYRWKVIENGLAYDRAEDLILITDRFFNGKRFGFEVSGILFQSSDTVTIQQYSLNENSFDFLRNLNIQAIGLGRSTSTPPSQVRGNLRNINDGDETILGYFGVSSVAEAEVILPEGP